MVSYETSMSRAGFNKGKSMLEVLASGIFHQDFSEQDKSAATLISEFIEKVSDVEDLHHLRGDIEGLLGFSSQADMLHYLDIMGASAWPPYEDVQLVFERALGAVDRRLAGLRGEALAAK